jgi:hypothetical protein
MQYLLFRSDPSPIGLSNLRMSLDIGVGLAALTNRVLIFYENEPVWDGPEPVWAKTHPDDARPTILDLFDVPVPHLDERFASDPLGRRAPLDRRRLYACDWVNVSESAFAHPRELAADDRRFTAFRNGRGHVHQLPPGADAVEFLQVSCRTFGLYSYYFYVRPEDWQRLHAAMAQVRAKAPYRELADDVARALGPFNALHLRRTDFGVLRNHHPVTPSEILANIEPVLPSDERLLICSDEAVKSPFFKPILNRYRHAVFFDDVLRKKKWAERFRALPYRRDVVVALLTQLVAAEAKTFVGSLGSTFTAMIHRARGFRDPRLPMLFAYNPFPRESSFADCRLTEVQEGAFTWNRVRLPDAAGRCSWWCEWPEAFASVAPTDARLPHEDPPPVALSATPRRRPRLYMERLGNEVLLLDRKEAKTIYLNQTAAIVWQLCDGSRTVADIAKHLGTAYPKVKGVRDDVQTAMTQLANQGAIELG